MGEELVSSVTPKTSEITDISQHFSPYDVEKSATFSGYDFADFLIAECRSEDAPSLVSGFFLQTPLTIF